MTVSGMLLGTILAVSPPKADLTHCTPGLSKFLQSRLQEFDQIPEARRAQLDPLIKWIRQRKADGQPVPLVFVCTHNSRRSQFGQVWARVAAEACGVSGVETASGGTEVTAMNPRTAAALTRAGFLVQASGPLENPRYEVRTDADAAPQLCFSKRFDAADNPRHGFAAIMTCTEADLACPQVPGASLRVSLPYSDPKVSDGTPDEEKVYDERCQQIAREMLYVMTQVKAAQP